MKFSKRITPYYFSQRSVIQLSIGGGNTEHKFLAFLCICIDVHGHLFTSLCPTYDNKHIHKHACSFKAVCHFTMILLFSNCLREGLSLALHSVLFFHSTYLFWELYELFSLNVNWTHIMPEVLPLEIVIKFHNIILSNRVRYFICPVTLFNRHVIKMHPKFLSLYMDASFSVHQETSHSWQLIQRPTSSPHTQNRRFWCASFTWELWITFTPHWRPMLRNHHGRGTRWF